jgi:hypothetical protein
VAYCCYISHFWSFSTDIPRLCRHELPSIEPRQTTLLTVTTGAVFGILVTISSCGAGAFGVTALLLLYPRLPMAIIARATSRMRTRHKGRAGLSRIILRSLVVNSDSRSPPFIAILVDRFQFHESLAAYATTERMQGHDDICRKRVPSGYRL